MGNISYYSAVGPNAVVIVYFPVSCGAVSSLVVMMQLHFGGACAAFFGQDR